MKKTSDTLYKLIKSFSEAEAAEFEKENGIEAKSTTALAMLYQIYKTEQTFEDAEIRLSTFHYSNISVLKTNLKNKIQAFLINNLPTSGLLAITEKFQELELYYSRGFFHEVELVIEEVKRLANQLGLIWPLFPSNHFKYKLSNHYISKNVEAYKQKIIEDNYHNVTELKRDLEIGAFSETVIGFMQKKLNHKSKSWLEKIEQFEQNPFFKLPDHTLSFYPKLSLNITRAAIAQSKGEHDKAFLAIKNNYDFLKSDWSFYFQYKRFETLTTIRNLLSVSIETNYKSKIKSILQEVEKLIEQGIIIEDYIIVFFMKTRLQYVLKFDPVLLKDELIIHTDYLKLKTDNKQSSNDRLYVLTVSVALFKLRKYRETIERILPLINQFSYVDNRSDLYIETVILYTMSAFSLLMESKQLFETGNVGFQQSYTSIYHSLRRNEDLKDRDIEKLLIRLFHLVKADTSYAEMKSEIKKAIIKMESLIIKQNAVADFINPIVWLKEIVAE